MRQRKPAMGLLGHEIFVPQSYQFGVEAQVDWYEIWAEFDGEPRKVYIFCMRSMASGAHSERDERAIRRDVHYHQCLGKERPPEEIQLR